MFFNQFDGLKTSRNHNVPWVQGAAWVATISKPSTFEEPKFCPPEARHRCTTQPRTVMTGSSSGSSRPRRRWMWRDEEGRGLGRGFGGKTLLRQWEFYVKKWMKCWWFKFLVDFCFQFCGKCRSKHVQHHFVLLFVVTIFQDCVLCPPRVVFFCGPTLGLCSWVSGSVHHSNVMSTFLQVW